MSSFLSPKELSQTFIDISTAKATKPVSRLFVLGLLAGVYIGFAAHLATTVGTGWTIGGEPTLFGLKKFFVGSVFSVGLMLVMIPGSELFTGNTLMTIGTMNRTITWRQLLKNWSVVWIANLVGSVLLALMIAGLSGLNSGAIGGTAINIAYDKVTAGGENHQMWFFFRAIGCNWLVTLAVMMATAAKDIGGKILAIFFPIMAFVTSGFEHSVANMYFIPAGIFSKSYDGAVAASGKSVEALAALNWGSMFSSNLLIVTLGNIVGGAVLVGMVYWWLYVKGTDQG